MQRTESQEHEKLKSLVLSLVSKMAIDSHPSRSAFLKVSLKSSLQDDLGIDSIGRAELALRVQQVFGVSLSDRVIAESETVGDVFEAIVLSRGKPQPIQSDLREKYLRPEPVVKDFPSQASTLIDVIRWQANLRGTQIWVEFVSPDKSTPEQLTFAKLLEESERFAWALLERGVRRSEPVAIMLPTSLEFFYSFFGILIAGGIPVPLYPPDRPSQIEESTRRQLKIIENCQARFLITQPIENKVFHILRGIFSAKMEIVDVTQLGRSRAQGSLPDIKSGEIAFLQYTSGSTGDPKGVILTHENLLANIRVMGTHVEVSARDIFVSWLPLYHDMGLIGAVMGTLYYGALLVLMSPITFLARPSRWLWMIHKYRGTLSAAPNFAYELCASRIDDAELEGLDLSSWRFALNGSEAVRPEGLSRFFSRFIPYKFRPTSLAPTYGLAESSVGLAFPKLGFPPVIDVIDKKIFFSEQIRKSAPPDSPADQKLSFVACGRALSGHRIRIADQQGHTLPEDQVGQIQFLGPSCTRGYYRNEQANQKLFTEVSDPAYKGKWLNSGDLGYFHGGELYVTGREKDLMIRGGQHFFPEDLEEKLSEIPGVRKGCAVVFGVEDRTQGTEKIVIVAETRARSEVEREKLRAEIARTGVYAFGAAVDEIVLAAPRSIPKTPSGKLRRARAKELYISGKLGKTHTVFVQIFLLELSRVFAGISRWWRLFVAKAYGVYAWVAVGILFIFWLPVLVFLPTLKSRMWASRILGRILFFVLGIKVLITGDRAVGTGISQKVYVFNHASYLDALLIVSFIPDTILFVAKKEFERARFMGPLLRRYGCFFVERSIAGESLDDVKNISESFGEKMALGIFAEGGFSREPGLKPFRMGAFELAAKKQVPVISVSLKGSRTLLPSEVWMLRRAKVEIHVSPPIYSSGSTWENLVAFRDQCRKEMLAHVGEAEIPD